MACDPEAPCDPAERALQQAALKHDMPKYIMGRLTANFGMAPDGLLAVCLDLILCFEWNYPFRWANSFSPPCVLTLQSASQDSQSGVVFVERGPVSHADFVFESRISAGAFGTVHLAHHTMTGERVAIKVLRPLGLH